MFQVRFMKEALAEARRALSLGSVPVGAVVVKNGFVVARAHNDNGSDGVSLPRPLRHAELLAAIQACQVIKSRWLEQCDVFVTLEPCPMCAEALRILRPAKIFFGAYDYANGFWSTYGGEKVSSSWEVVGGLCETECGELLKQYFRERREK